VTYCLAAQVDEGLVFASDSRTHAGVGDVSTYRKMHVYEWPGERLLVVLCAGNLATTQAVGRALQRDIDDAAAESLATVASLDAAADYLGRLSVACQAQAAAAAGDGAQVPLEATFVIGGQIGAQAPEIHRVYPQGNFITVSAEQPFIQIGETRYGKPILDRMIGPALPLERAGLCALVSLDSTMRSNLSVGPPVDLLIYPRDSLNTRRRLSLAAEDPYWLSLREAWGAGLGQVLETLPEPPVRGISE
jgi:putative proteasome-type protease